LEITAAVVDEPGAAFALQPVTLEEPRADEVRIQIKGSGVCHTDVTCRDQWIPVPLPVVLGHEGSGIVEAVGSGVTELAPGDHVVLSWGRGCGHCPNCLRGEPAYCDDMGRVSFGCTRLDDGSTAISRGGEPVHSHFIMQSSFATHAVVPARHAVKVDPNLPIELLGPLGCGILTGAGAVWDAMRVAPGASIAIFGVGAVGLSAVMAAQVAGATTIIAIDRNSDRLALAQELGATHVIDASSADISVSDAIQQIAPGGVDHSLEATGAPEVLRTAVEALRLRGECVLVGAAPFGTEATLDVFSILLGRSLRGCIVGDLVPSLQIPRMLALYKAGRFPFDRLIQTYPFAELNQAVADSLDGRTVKPVVVMD
jgi:aryl-alcohol dehydrogenase